ncbi:hypothetical protein [Clostridium butyricum]|jgi:hypothetical protein
MNISSKKLSLIVSEKLLELCNDPEKRPFNCDGILLLTAFGFVYGKFHQISNEGEPRTISDFLVHSRNSMAKKIELDNDTLINDGSLVIIKDAVVKYTANNCTLNMSEIIIFADQIIGFYPIDLKVFDNQQS